MNSKNKLPIIIAAVVIVGLVGAYMTGMVGPKKADPNANKRYVVPPVALAEPFTVNTADPDGTAYLQLGVAVQLEPMKAEYWKNFSGAGGGGHGGGGEAPGVGKVANYPKFRNAVIETASHFTAAELRSEKGKTEFKSKLMEEFHKIAEVDEAEAKAAPEDPAHHGVEPPYHVKQVEFTNFAVQAPLG